MRLRKIFKQKKNTKKPLFISIAILGIIGIAFFVSTSFSQTTEEVVLDISLSSDNYDPTTKTFYDRSGKENHGTSINDATLTTGRYGSVDGAMSFDGNDKVTTPYDVNNITNNNHTVVAWVKTDKNLSTDSLDRLTIFKDSTAWSPGIWFHGSTIRAHTDGKYTDVSWSQDNEWHLIGQVYDSSTNDLRIILDGNIISGTETNYSASPSGTLEIGSNPGASSVSPFDGLIDKVKVYNYALTDEEVQNLYESGRSVGVSSSLNEGLVAHYTMDEDDYNTSTGILNDKTPYENNCNNVNSAIFATDRHNKDLKTVDFKGTSYLNCGGDSSVKIIDNQTYAFWINSRDFAARRNPINIAYGGEGTITLETNGAFSYYYGTAGANTTPYQGQRSSVSISANTWHHVAHVRDLSNNQMVWYIDGEEAGIAAPSYSQAVASTNDLWIGDGYVSPINGLMDDVRIYNRALSQKEIQSLYDSYEPKTTTGSLQKGLILDMPLKLKYTKDETNGSEIMTDRTPYSNDGQNHGATIASEGASFDGVNDYVDNQNIVFDYTDNWSFSLWSNFDTNSGTYWNGMIGGSHGNGGYWMFHGGGAELTYYSDYYDSTAYIYYSGLDHGSELIENEWNNITVTAEYQSGRDVLLKIYINGGEYYREHLFTLSPRTSNYNFNSIGSVIGRYYEGQLSNVKVYNRALSDEEVKTLYDRGRSDAGIIFQDN